MSVWFDTIIQYSIPAINLLGSAASISSFFNSRKNLDHEKIKRKIYFINFILLLLLSILSFNVLSIYLPYYHASKFYDRYSNSSFSKDFSEDKIRSVMMDGMIVFKKTNFEGEYPKRYSEIERHYEDAIDTEPFDKSKSIKVAREIFGACGSISGKLYESD